MFLEKNVTFAICFLNLLQVLRQTTRFSKHLIFSKYGTYCFFTTLIVRHFTAYKKTNPLPSNPNLTQPNVTKVNQTVAIVAQNDPQTNRTEPNAIQSKLQKT